MMKADDDINVVNASGIFFPYNFLFKLVMVGNSLVGKSCLLKALNNINVKKNNNDPTIGVDFTAKTVTLDNGKIIKTHIWDTAGQEIFHSIISQYYRGSSGIILMYDVTNRESFEKLNFWINEIRQHSFDGISILLLGNKTDLKDKRKVQMIEGETYAKENGLLFSEISVFESSDIVSIFKILIQDIYDKADLDNIDENVDNHDIETSSNLRQRGIVTRNIKTIKQRSCYTLRNGCC